MHTTYFRETSIFPFFGVLVQKKKIFCFSDSIVHKTTSLAMVELGFSIGSDGHADKVFLLSKQIYVFLLGYSNLYLWFSGQSYGSRDFFDDEYTCSLLPLQGF